MGVTEAECRGTLDARHSGNQWTVAGIDTIITLAQPFLGGDEAPGNRVDCTAGINFLRAALASSDAPYGVPTRMWAAGELGTWTLTFGAPLGAGGLTPAMTALSTTDIDPETKQDPWVQQQQHSLPENPRLQGTPASPASCFHLPLASRES